MKPRVLSIRAVNRTGSQLTEALVKPSFPDLQVLAQFCL
jgi:hypothetical protein